MSRSTTQVATVVLAIGTFALGAARASVGAAAPTPPSAAATPTPAPDRMRYDAGRLTVRVTDAPLDRVLGEIAAVTHATVHGSVGARPVSIDMTDVPLSDALARIFGAESFMLTYAGDGTLRAITMIGNGVGVPVEASPSSRPTATPRPPLAEEEDQAKILQRPVAVTGALATAVGRARPPVGRVLHAALQERSPAVRAAAREAALAALARDPEVEAAYLSTLAPVDDAVLAKIFRSTGPEGAAEEWMAALASRASSPALRAKAAAVLAELRK